MSRQFAVIPERATFDRAVSPAMYRMLGALGSYATRDGWCWPELSTLAGRLDQTEGAVQKMIRRLIDAGYVEMHYETRKGRRCCVYRILYDRTAETIKAIADAELEEAPAAGDSHPRLSPASSLDENERAARVEPKESQRRDSLEQGSTQRPPRQVSTFPQESSVFLEEGAVERVVASSSPPPRARWERLLDRVAALSSETHREVLAARLEQLAARAAFRADALAAEIEAIEQGMHGPAATLEQIAQAVQEMALLTGDIPAKLLRACVRKVVAGEEPRPPAGLSRGAWRPDTATVDVGGQIVTPELFWQLCTDVGLTSPMQSAETVRAEVERLVRDGRVQDGPAFLALVLHVNPAQLAEEKWRKARDQQLRERLSSWRGRAA